MTDFLRTIWNRAQLCKLRLCLGWLTGALSGLSGTDEMQFAA
jgi:hypothetical protein